MLFYWHKTSIQSQHCLRKDSIFHYCVVIDRINGKRRNPFFILTCYWFILSIWVPCNCTWDWINQNQQTSKDTSSSSQNIFNSQIYPPADSFQEIQSGKQSMCLHHSNYPDSLQFPGKYSNRPMNCKQYHVRPYSIKNNFHPVLSIYICE